MGLTLAGNKDNSESNLQSRERLSEKGLEFCQNTSPSEENMQRNTGELYFCLEFKVSCKCSNTNFCSTSSHAKFKNWQKPRDRCERLAQWEQPVLTGRRRALGSTVKHTQGTCVPAPVSPRKEAA